MHGWPACRGGVEWAKGLCPSPTLIHIDMTEAEAPQASVCWMCGCNMAKCLANFGLEDPIDGRWDVAHVPPVPSQERAIFLHQRGRFCGIPGEVHAICFGGVASPIWDTDGYDHQKTARKFWLPTRAPKSKQYRLECPMDLPAEVPWNARKKLWWHLWYLNPL